MKHNVSFPERMVQEIDNKVAETKQYLNRSHFVTEACREKLEREKPNFISDREIDKMMLKFLGKRKMIDFTQEDWRKLNKNIIKKIIEITA